MSSFYRFLNKADTEPAELIIDGPIESEAWFDDDVTPRQFRSELNTKKGDLTVWINSPGGDCFAASQIYTMLKEYKGKVTVKVDGIAASAASVIAMAGDEVLMAPTAMMMIHNPLTIAFGNKDDMEQAIAVLEEVKESIINAYEMKTGLQRAHISRLMDEETWMNARKAIDLKFADGMIAGTSNTAGNAYTYNAKQTAEKIVASAVAFANRQQTEDKKMADEAVKDYLDNFDNAQKLPKDLIDAFRKATAAADNAQEATETRTAQESIVDEQTDTQNNESTPDSTHEAQNGKPIDEYLRELNEKKKYL